MAIRQNTQVKGICLQKESPAIKIVQYADDAVLFFNDPHEMEVAINLVSEFGTVAGTKINRTKCEGLWLGAFKHYQSNCTLFDIKWPKEPIRCLGIYIGHDGKSNTQLNSPCARAL